MPSKALPPRPTDAELESLTVLWSIGPATVRQVSEVISGRRTAQYSTILKFMQMMVDKCLLLRDGKERAHVYRAARPREWTQRQLAGHLLEPAFSGSAKALVMGALSAKRTSKSELAEIRALLDEYAKGVGRTHLRLLDRPSQNHIHRSLWVNRKLNAAFPHARRHRLLIHERLKAIQLLRNRISSRARFDGE